jgi:HAE1 family hydrophobic/amphiphilic exporter-1
MAVVVIGGLITSTMLTLLVVPVVFSLIEGLRDRVRRRKPPTAIAVGSALVAAPTLVGATIVDGSAGSGDAPVS